MVADPVPTTLRVEADTDTIAAQGRDTVRVIVRGLDQVGSIVPFLNDIVTVSIDGPARLIGPGTLMLAGGTTGFWLESTGQAGAITLRVSSERYGSQTVALTAA